MATQKQATDLVSSFRDVRRASTPIVAVSTSNQPDAITRLADTNNGPAFSWDCIRGLQGEPTALRALAGDDQEASPDPVTALEILANVPDGSMVYMINAHAFCGDARVSTGIGNLRDAYKSKGCTLVLLGPSFDLPPELAPDVVRLSDPLPTDAQLREVIATVADSVVESGQTLAPITQTEYDAATNALRGLSTFGAEQQLFMALQKDPNEGHLYIDQARLWERAIEVINATPGLSMRYERKDRDCIRGLDGITRGLFDRLFREDNDNRPQVILHIDEIDKSLGGTGATGGPGDSSGTAQDQLGVLLQTMQDKRWNGLIPVGPPGVGKTLISETIAGIYGVPYIRFDLGALKGSLVGESEQKVRGAVEVVDRIGNGRVFVLATCNRLDSMPPELKRRFKRGTWYFDIPDSDGRGAIWDLYLEQFDIDHNQVDGEQRDRVLGEANLTGAEIFNLCETACDLGCTLDEARELITPVYLSAAGEIAKLRKVAEESNFLDAARGSFYKQNRDSKKRAGRKLAGGA